MLYLSTLKGTTLHSLLPGWEDTASYCFNPSMTVYQDRLIATFRKTNIERVDRNARYYLLPPYKTMRNEVLIGEFDKDFSLIRQTEIDLKSKTMKPLTPTGMEDLRLIASPDGRLEGMACLSSDDFRITPHGGLIFHENFSTRMARVQFGPGFEITGLTTCKSPYRRRLEKNWSPFYWQGKFCIVYQWNPLIIMELFPDGSTKVLKWFKPYERLTFMRGSSQGVPTKNGYLFVIHRKCAYGGKVRFGHNFIELGHDLRPLRMGTSWFGIITSKQIEYCAGVAIYRGRCLVSFGLNDAMPMMLTLGEDQVEALMEHSLEKLEEDTAAMALTGPEAAKLANVEFSDNPPGFVGMKMKVKQLLVRAVERFVPLQ